MHLVMILGGCNGVDSQQPTVPQVQGYVRGILPESHFEAPINIVSLIDCIDTSPVDSFVIADFVTPSSSMGNRSWILLWMGDC